MIHLVPAEKLKGAKIRPSAPPSFDSNLIIHYTHEKRLQKNKYDKRISASPTSTITTTDINPTELYYFAHTTHLIN